LAIVPLLFSAYLPKYENKKIKWLIILMSWALFFPNAPYLVTDLMYLAKIKPNLQIPFWYDIIMLSSFALTGLLLGFASAKIVFYQLKNKISKSWAFGSMGFYLMLSGYGVYLGRFGRYNSWDVITQPLNLLEDIADTLIHPFHHKNVYLLSILFGSLVCLIFYSLYELIEHQKK
jgi:uncharacterized membrane protein